MIGYSSRREKCNDTIIRTLTVSCTKEYLQSPRPSAPNRERASLIKSGNVFVYEEDSSGIKRWTDGVPWSPSRILGDFLVYRELERPFPLGEKRKAMKRSKRSPGTSKAPEIYGGSNNGMSNGYNVASAAASIFDFANSNSETDRSLIGSLGDSYGFKEDGLVKKATVRPHQTRQF
ncbi:Gti1/Pac2 family-domain-containing protein [Leptodontidium sp. MPI-SDFR-AT-0119]|nr:Gti1/Pac2 family-domain-containing protein [Leptodontidium sp. MPI-SDFR-AT-0119]